MCDPAGQLAEMTALELGAYRRNLEHALTLPALPSSCWLPREQLQQQLDAVLAGDAEREHRGAGTDA